MRRVVRRIALLFVGVVAGLACIGGLALDWTGYIAVLEKPADAGNAWAEALHFLFSMPGWMSAAILLLVILLLYWSDLIRWAHEEEEEVKAAFRGFPWFRRSASEIGQPIATGAQDSAALLADELRRQREARENEGSVEDVMRWALSPRRNEWRSQPLPVAYSNLKLSVGEAEPYFKTEGAGLYRFKRILRLRIENISHSDPITDIRVQVLSIEPQTEYTGPWTLKTGLTLAAGADEFIPFASFGEPHTNATYRDRFIATDTFFEILANNPARPGVDRETAQVLTIRATGLGTAPCDFRCKLWVDRLSGRLRIGQEDADETSQPEFVSLYEAARTAYEKSSNLLRKAAAAEGDNADKIIKWFSYFLGSKLSIYGEHLPSRIKETYSVKENRTDFDFFVIDEKVESRGRHDDGRWVNLCVRGDELKIVIQDILNQKGENER